MDAASRRSGRRIRADLLRRGALRAVIALPVGAAPPYNIPLHLWVLRRPGKAVVPPRLLLVDTGRLVPEGVPGELHVASAGMPEGYHGMDGLTAERFSPNPFGAQPSARLYNTGDVVRHLPDGTLDFIGRWDFQVKVRGFRVDVRQVEKVLFNRVLKHTHGHQAQASELLGLNRSTLRAKLRDLGIAGIFLPGSPMQDIVDFINARVQPRAEAI